MIFTGVIFILFHRCISVLCWLLLIIGLITSLKASYETNSISIHEAFVILQAVCLFLNQHLKQYLQFISPLRFRSWQCLQFANRLSASLKYMLWQSCQRLDPVPSFVLQRNMPETSETGISRTLLKRSFGLSIQLPCDQTLTRQNHSLQSTMFFPLSLLLSDLTW